jgi:hypothetical protein
MVRVSICINRTNKTDGKGLSCQRQIKHGNVARLGYLPRYAVCLTIPLCFTDKRVGTSANYRASETTSESWNYRASPHYLAFMQNNSVRATIPVFCE